MLELVVLQLVGGTLVGVDFVFEFLERTRITPVKDDALVCDVGLSLPTFEVADNLRPGCESFFLLFLEENLSLELCHHLSGATGGGVLEGLQDVGLAQRGPNWRVGNIEWRRGFALSWRLIDHRKRPGEN